MRPNPKPQEFYRHFKGNVYQIRCLARHTETGELLVVYQAMYGTFELYARPLSMFMGEVDRTRYPEIKQKYRFELLQDIDMDGSMEESADGEGERTEVQCETAPAAAAEKASDTTDTAAAAEKASDTTDTATNAEEVSDTTDTAAETESEQKLELDPLVVEFLDADTYEERLNLLAALHPRITDEMINTLAVAVDVEIKEGDVQMRYEELKNCLLMLEKYECNRLR